MNMAFIAGYWPASCLLAFCLLVCLLFTYFLLLYSAGGDGEGQPEIKLFVRGGRSPKTVAKRRFHLRARNLLAKNVVSVAQNSSETLILLARNPLGKNAVAIQCWPPT